MYTTNWLATLATDSLGDFEISESLDRDLSLIASGARSNPSERDELFTLLSAKVERFTMRFRYWDLTPWSFDDVLQLSYLVFVSTIERWGPRAPDAAPAGYLYYFLSVFPLWLASEVSRLLGRRRPASFSLDAQDTEDLEREPGMADLDGAAIIDDLCERLTPIDARLLRVRVHTGKSIPQAAKVVGLARRTAYRRWNNIVEIGREYLEEAG